MLLRDGKVLFGLRHPKWANVMHGEGTWTMPGGKLHYGEKLEDCIRRETKEETGIELGELSLLCVNDDFATDAHYVTVEFLCTDFTGEAEVMEPEKITEWKWFPLTNLPSPLYGPSEKVMRQYLNTR